MSGVWLLILVAFDQLCSCEYRPGIYQSRSGTQNDDVVVHLFEWSWRDITIECKTFLGPKGFKAVQVSPPQEDAVGDHWWTRYQPVSFKLDSRSGNEEDFVSMVNACREAGVDVIVDVVLNHMANPSTASLPAVGRAGSVINSRCEYPGTYTCDHFHHFCSPACTCPDCSNCGVADGCDADNIRHCNLGQSSTDPGLPDLDTSHDWVRTSIANYLNKLASIGVAGVRVDASKHIDTTDMAAILARTNASLYLNHEVVLEGGETCITAPMFYSLGRVWEFKSANVFSAAIKGGDLRALRDMSSESTWPGGSSIWARSDMAVSFVANHDRLVNAQARRDRTVTIFDQGGYAVANLILLAHPYGQPVVLSSINFAAREGDYGGAPVDTSACPAPGKCPLLPVHNPSHRGLSTPQGCAFGNLSSPQPYHCEHRWPWIANMVGWRRAAGLAGITMGGAGMQYFNGKQLGITRGEGMHGVAFLFVSIDEHFDGAVDTKGMPAGIYCNVLADAVEVEPLCWPCTQACPHMVTVEADGSTHITIGRFQAVAIHHPAILPKRDGHLLAHTPAITAGGGTGPGLLERE